MDGTGYDRRGNLWVRGYEFGTHATLTLLTCGLWLLLIAVVEFVSWLRWRMTPKSRGPEIHPLMQDVRGRYLRGEITQDAYEKWRDEFEDWRRWRTYAEHHEELDARKPWSLDDPA